jgi:hypothetical protein
VFLVFIVMSCEKEYYLSKISSSALRPSSSKQYSHAVQAHMVPNYSVQSELVDEHEIMEIGRHKKRTNALQTVAVDATTQALCVQCGRL